MNEKLIYYLRLQSVIAALFNFFISGMIAALIYHKADFVPTDTVSIAVDITVTCFLTFAFTMLFSRASLRRDKTEGVITANTKIARLTVWFSRRPVLQYILLSLCASFILSVPTVFFFMLLGVAAMPFYLYISLKSVFSAMLGAFATFAFLYAGMNRAG